MKRMANVVDMHAFYRDGPVDDEHVLVDRDGENTMVSILDMSADGYGYLVFIGEDQIGSADTLRAAKRLVRDYLG